MTLRCQAVEQVRFSRMGKAQKPLVASVVSFLSVSGICPPPREFANTSGEMPIPERLGWRAKPGSDRGQLLVESGGLRARALNMKSVDGF